MITMSTIAQTVTAATLQLTPHSDSPRLDAELLLSKLLGLSRSTLIARNQETLAMECEMAYAKMITRRAAGAPVAYLTGGREFWSLPLIVTPAVLVPRPETETLIERALELKGADEACSVLDLGTGSGAIALAMACERPHWRVTGVEVSEAAMQVAKLNSQALALTRIEWRLGSWFDAVKSERFDLILANPPYIAAADPALASLSAEPAIALSPGPTGLEALSMIIGSAPGHLLCGGWLVLEHGCTQDREVSELLIRRGFSAVRSYVDLSGKPRVTLGTYTQH
jgi:release factor glutamine methyltransferase